MTKPEEKKVRETKKEHVDEEKNKKAWENKASDEAGRDWSKPAFFNPGDGV